MRNLLFIIFCFCALVGNAQVKNAYGQNVVRKVDVYLPKENKPYITINFNYSNSLNLEELRVVAPSSKVILKRDGEQLTRVDYDSNGRKRNDIQYEYTILNNLVAKCNIDNIGTNGSILRYSYFYRYGDSNEMLSADRRVFTREREGKFTELSDRYREKFLWCVEGTVYTTSEKTWQWKIGQEFDYPILFTNRSYYYELNNNVNIDLFLLYQEVKDFQRLERFTEWCGKRPSYLIEKDNGNYFDYTYDNEYGGLDLSDDRGKIIQMDVYDIGKRLNKTFKITYWD